jgi:hypothetical protein
MRSSKSHPIRSLFNISRSEIALFLLVLLIASSVSASLIKTRLKKGEIADNAQPSKASAKQCCGQDIDQPHFLAASYYKVGGNLTATLMLNNKGPQPVEVSPTLFSLSGERFEATPVVVEGESFRNFDLREFGALPGTLFEEGSLQLFHSGPDLVIGAQLYLHDERNSLSFDEKLVEFKTVPSTQLESVWWLPSRRAHVSLILSNTSEQTVSANAVINAGTPQPQAVDLILAPHETRVIKVNQHKDGAAAGFRNGVGSASIQHTDAKGALIARALVEEQNSGYSFSAQFYYPQGGKSSTYQGAGLRLSTSTGEELTPIVVARNVGEKPTELTGRLPYTMTDGTVGVVQLPKARLNPGEATTLDLERAIRRELRSKQIAAASIEFNYTTAPGSVVMTTETVSSDGNQVFRVPMWDVPAQRNGTGGYPWFIEGSSSTYVYIKNVTEKEQKYTFSLTYEGGDYSVGLKTIKVGETVVFDVRAMRDNQIPDERAQRIPLNATRGKIVWSVRGANSLALLGRSEQVDLVKGISSSYACHMCCPNSVRNTWIDPVSLDMFSGDVTNFRGVERDSTCYGGLTPPYYIGDSWTTDNSNVAGVSGIGSDADVTAINSGTATVTAQWDVYSYTSTYNFELGTYVCEESSEQAAPNTPVQVAPAPDHLIVLADQQGFTTQTPTGTCATQYFIRQIKFQVVSKDPNPMAVGNVPVEEQFASVTTNTCGNGQPQASGCAPTVTDGTATGTFIESVSPGCGSANGPANCGYDINWAWYWCGRANGGSREISYSQC